MAAICPVCNEKIHFGELLSTHEVDGFEIHDKDCILKYRENPEKYGGKAREPDNESIERLQKTKEILNVSCSIFGTFRVGSRGVGRVHWALHFRRIFMEFRVFLGIIGLVDVLMQDFQYSGSCSPPS